MEDYHVRLLNNPVFYRTIMLYGIIKAGFL